MEFVRLSPTTRIFRCTCCWCTFCLHSLHHTGVFSFSLYISTYINIYICYNITSAVRKENESMISNTGTIPTLHGGNITLETITRKTDVGNRRTKIICTLGPACWSEENLGTLMDAGMNVARFNFSHGDHAGHNEVLQRLRKVAAQKARNIGTFIESPNSTGSWIPLIHSLSHTRYLSLCLQRFYWIQKDPKFAVAFLKKDSRNWIWSRVKRSR